jgi:hypothetical protein
VAGVMAEVALAESRPREAIDLFRRADRNHDTLTQPFRARARHATPSGPSRRAPVA